MVDIALEYIAACPEAEAPCSVGVDRIVGCHIPASIHMAVHAELFSEFSSIMLEARHPLHATHRVVVLLYVE